MDNINNANRDGQIPTSEVREVNTASTKMVVPGEVGSRETSSYMEPVIASSFSPNDIKGVADFLGKPIPVSSGTWATSSVAGTMLLDATSTSMLTAQPIWLNKLRGFQGFRARLHLRLVLNATPFHQGRLRLCYYPAGELNSDKVFMHKGHRIPLSQLPGVEVNVAESSVELELPYISPQRFIELNSNLFSWGNIFLTVMSPLAVGASGSNAITWTLWAWMTEVELIGQTNKATAQSEGGRFKNQTKLKNRSKRPPTEVEHKPISSILAKGAELAGSLTQIPILSNYAGPAAWALNAASGAAAALGWSKPVEDNALSRVSLGYHYNMANCTGMDNSFTMGLFSDNKLGVLLDPTPSGEDEMSYEYIKTRWSFWQDISWSTTATTGTQLSRMVLTPTDFRAEVSRNEVYLSPLSYLAELHHLYRGGVDICVKLSKTGFHAGSLAISYAPGPTDATVSLTDTSYLHRTIIDLQQGDEFCLRFPYTLPLDYLNTELGLGAMYVHVVNPLKAPETVASSIILQIYVRGAPDLEFQLPRAPVLVPVEAQWGEVLEAQAGDVEAEGDIVCAPVGEIHVSGPDTIHAEQCTGEYPRSILSLLKRYVPVYNAIATPGALSISPGILSKYRYNASTLTKPSFRTNYQSFILSTFAFMRGGFRWRLTSNVNATAINHAMYAWFETRTTPTLDSWVSIKSIKPTPMWTDTASTAFAHQQTRNGGISLQVPYSCVYRMESIAMTYDHTKTIPFDARRGKIVFQVPVGVSDEYWVLRAAADDFQAIFFVGCPRFSYDD